MPFVNQFNMHHNETQLMTSIESLKQTKTKIVFGEFTEMFSVC